MEQPELCVRLPLIVCPNPPTKQWCCCPAAPEEEVNKAAAKYQTFWAQFGKAMKLGVIEDSQNRNRLAKLLRVQTSKSGGKLISLEEYVERMKPGQKNIYYLAGEEPCIARGSQLFDPSTL